MICYIFWNGKDVIHDLKSQHSTQFNMKDLKVAKYLLSLELGREWEWKKKLWLDKIKYIYSLLQHFCMENCKPLTITIFVGIKFLVDQFSTTPLEMEDMAYVSYTSVICILVYVMVYTKLDVTK